MRRKLLLTSLFFLTVVLFLCFRDQAAMANLPRQIEGLVARVREYLFPDNLQKLERGLATVEELEQGRIAVPFTNSLNPTGRVSPTELDRQHAGERPQQPHDLRPSR